MRIYIIGPVGSGKTTLSKKLANKYHTKSYELDKVVWDDSNGNHKRNFIERDQLFQKIIQHKSWIIEDVGRKCFVEGVKKADVVYYIALPITTLLYRVVRRWIHQRRGYEAYSYPPTFQSLIQMMGWAIKNWFQRHEKLLWIRDNTDKLIILRKKDFSHYE